MEKKIKKYDATTYTQERLNAEQVVRELEVLTEELNRAGMEATMAEKLQIVAGGAKSLVPIITRHKAEELASIPEVLQDVATASIKSKAEAICARLMAVYSPYVAEDGTINDEAIREACTTYYTPEELQVMQECDEACKHINEALKKLNAMRMFNRELKDLFSSSLSGVCMQYNTNKFLFI